MDISLENLYLDIGAQVDNSLISFIFPWLDLTLILAVETSAIKGLTACP